MAWALACTWVLFPELPENCLSKLIILFLRGLGFCVWRADCYSVSVNAACNPWTVFLLSSFGPATSEKLPATLSASWCIKAAFLRFRCLYVRCSTDIYLLELYLYFSLWMGNSSSLRWFLYHSDSPDWQISRCCQIAPGSKFPFIFSAHFLWCFQQLCSLCTRTHVTSSKGPISSFRFSAASSFPAFFLPHPVHYWVICLLDLTLTEIRDLTDFLLMQGDKTKTRKYFCTKQYIHITYFKLLEKNLDSAFGK